MGSHVIRARARGSPGPLQAPPATARQRCRTHTGTVTASLPSHVALGPVLHPSFQLNYHFNLKILLKLLVPVFDLFPSPPGYYGPQQTLQLLKLYKIG